MRTGGYPHDFGNLHIYIRIYIFFSYIYTLYIMLVLKALLMDIYIYNVNPGLLNP